jgi:AraC-like DNA-binding protein
MTIDNIRFPDTSYSFREENSHGDRAERSGESLYTTAQLIESIVDHMRQNLEKSFRVSTLSSMIGCSNSHFYTLFRSRTGCSPKQFLTRLQMQRACELLASNTASVKEVALALGYTDQFYFSRVFKLNVGIAPSHYRQKNVR